MGNPKWARASVHCAVSGCRPALGCVASPLAPETVRDCSRLASLGTGETRHSLCLTGQDSSATHPGAAACTSTGHAAWEAAEGVCAVALAGVTACLGRHETGWRGACVVECLAAGRKGCVVANAARHRGCTVAVIYHVAHAPGERGDRIAAARAGLIGVGRGSHGSL